MSFILSLLHRFNLLALKIVCLSCFWFFASSLDVQADSQTAKSSYQWKQLSACVANVLPHCIAQNFLVAAYEVFVESQLEKGVITPTNEQKNQAKTSVPPQFTQSSPPPLYPQYYNFYKFWRQWFGGYLPYTQTYRPFTASPQNNQATVTKVQKIPEFSIGLTIGIGLDLFPLEEQLVAIETDASLQGHSITLVNPEIALWVMDAKGKTTRLKTATTESTQSQGIVALAERENITGDKDKIINTLQERVYHLQIKIPATLPPMEVRAKDPEALRMEVSKWTRGRQNRTADGCQLARDIVVSRLVSARNLMGLVDDEDVITLAVCMWLKNDLLTLQAENGVYVLANDFLAKAQLGRKDFSAIDYVVDVYTKALIPVCRNNPDLGCNTFLPGRSLWSITRNPENIKLASKYLHQSPVSEPPRTVPTVAVFPRFIVDQPSGYELHNFNNSTTGRTEASVLPKFKLHWTQAQGKIIGLTRSYQWPTQLRERPLVRVMAVRRCSCYQDAKKQGSILNHEIKSPNLCKPLV